MNIRYSSVVADGGLEHPIRYIEGACDSSETKPVAYIADGSMITESNTGDTYIFNAKTSEWKKIGNLISGGGGNPNTVQTVMGTVANPWGSMTEADYNMFVVAYYSGNASAKMVVDASALGAEEPLVGSIDYAHNEPTFNSLSLSPTSLEAARIAYYGVFDGGNNLAVASFITENGGTITDLAPYASMLPTTLTIYWHPMP